MSDHYINSRHYRLRECGKCGIEFLVPAKFDDENREAGKSKTWYCPNGHPRAYLESEADTLRRERDLLKQQMAQKDDEIAAEKRRREDAEKSAAVATKAATRLKKRAAAGTCPCCQRTFSNMSEHIKKQHPEFVTETGAKVVRIMQVARPPVRLPTSNRSGGEVG